MRARSAPPYIPVFAKGVRLRARRPLEMTTRTSAIRTLDDARKREVTMGVTGFANIFALGPLMLNRTAATRFKIIAGYKGASDITLAMQRGEVVVEPVPLGVPWTVRPVGVS